MVIVTYGTGGAEIANELYKHIDCEIWSCSDFASSKLKCDHKRMTFEEVMENIVHTDIVVTDRTNGLEFQNNVTKIANENNTPTIAITDIFIPNVTDYNKQFTEKPQYITAVNKLAYEELVKAGFNEDSIIKTGNPSFIRLGKYEPKFPENPKVLFISQGGPTNINHNELQEYYLEIKSKLGEHFNKFDIDIKLHPMEESHREMWVDKPLEVDNSVDFIQKLGEYDILTGFYSTLQIQGNAMGIPTIHKWDNIDEKLEQYKNKICESENDMYPIGINKIKELINDIKTKIHNI